MLENMEGFTIKKAAFETSVGLGGKYPSGGVQIAMVGKSNVGKSSLINSLCNNFKLARISSSPGKTRLINFFRVNDAFYLVDLPGYGFAKAPKVEQEKWGKLMEDYLASGLLTHIFLLKCARALAASFRMECRAREVKGRLRRHALRRGTCRLFFSSFLRGLRKWVLTYKSPFRIIVE